MKKIAFSKYILSIFLICIISFSLVSVYGVAKTPNKHLKHEDEISGERMCQYVNDITNFGWTLAGSTANELAADYIMQKFIEFGLEGVGKEPYTFPPPMMYAEDWSLTVISGSSPAPSVNKLVTSYPIYYASTEPEPITAELVYAGYGTPSEFPGDVAGKIVLVDNFRPAGPLYSYSMIQVDQTAASLGALAVVIAHVPLAEGWGGNGPVAGQGFRLGRRSPLPGLQVGMHDGAYLRDLAKSGGVQVELYLNVVETEVNDCNVVGTLPGMSDDIILVGAHLDACSWIGTVGNAGGIAVLLELAEYYAKMPISEREKTMMFVSFGSHHIFDSPTAFIEANPDLIPKIACFVNLDNPAGPRGYQQINGRLIETNSIEEKRALMVSNGNPLLISITKDAFDKYKLTPYHTFVSYMGVGGSNFIPAGVPTLSVMTYGVFAHQLYDTPETVAFFPQELKRAAKAHVQIIDELDVIPADEIKAANNPTNPSPVDDQPPEPLIKPLQTPKYPFETDTVKIQTMFLWELIAGMKSVELAYSTDKVNWNYVPMTRSMPLHVPIPILFRLAGDRYTGEIPAHPTGTTVYYKLIATDGANNVAVDDNNGKLYKYEVGEYKLRHTYSGGGLVYWTPAGPDGIRGFDDDPHPIPVAYQHWRVKYEYKDADHDGMFSWGTADYLTLKLSLEYFIMKDFTPGSNQMGTFRTWDSSFDQPSIIAASSIIDSKALLFYKHKFFSPTLTIWQTWNPTGLGPTGENSGLTNYASGTFKAGMIVVYEMTLKISDRGSWRGGLYLYDWIDWPRPFHPGYAWIDMPVPP